MSRNSTSGKAVRMECKPQAVFELARCWAFAQEDETLATQAVRGEPEATADEPGDKPSLREGRLGEGL